MTPTEAANKLRETVKEIKVIKECVDYDEDYLFVAFKTNNPAIELDPFYLVGKADGDIRCYNIFEDVSKFYNSERLDF